NWRRWNQASVFDIAVLNGMTDVVALFLAKGFPFDAIGSYGYTPLECAASQGHVEIVKLLVQAGADVQSLNYRGERLLTFAIRSELRFRTLNPRLATEVGRTIAYLREVGASEDPPYI